MNGLANGTAPNALSADFHGSGGPIILGHANFLQIGSELATSDPGDLGTDATQILGLATSLDGVSLLSPFTTNFTYSRHDRLPQN